MHEVFFLSIIQGVTEFLPISSSAHLIIVSKYFNFNNAGLGIDISLHLGSLLAIIFYFKKDLLSFTDNKNLFFKIILSSMPVMIFGFILIKFNLIDYLRNYKVIGWSTIIFGVLLYFSDLVKAKKKTPCHRGKTTHNLQVKRRKRATPIGLKSTKWPKMTKQTQNETTAHTK